MPATDTAASNPSARAAPAPDAPAVVAPAPLEQAANRVANEEAIPAVFRGALKPLYPLYRSFQLWSDADGLRMSAAMSFYGMFSIAPLLLVLVALLGYVVDEKVVQSSLIHQIESLVGAKGAEVIQAAIASAQQPGDGVFASVLAFVFLVVGATGVFAELQSALERLWTQGTGAQAVDAWWHSATLRLRGIAYVLAFGFLMLVSLVIASTVNLLQTWAGSRYQMEALFVVLNQVLSLAITTALFVALMRMSAGPQPRLRYLVAGGAIGALLFGVGKYALAIYLSTAAVVSAYGAAGSLVVLLMWVYFASAVLLYGASCARVLAERQGDFAAAATPPPAAAVTAAQGEVRQAAGDDVAANSAAVTAVLSDMASAPGAPSDAARTAGAANARPGSTSPAARAAQAAATAARNLRPTALVGNALAEAVDNVRGKDLAVAAVVGVASYFLLRPRGGEARAEAMADVRTGLRSLIGQQQRRVAGDVNAAASAAANAASAAAANALPRRSTRGAALAVLGSGAARQGARWLWQGTRVARSEAVARLGRRRKGVVGGASQLLAQANAWRERHALAQARRALDADLRELRRAARRRR